jgi:hypothetical protein
MRPLSTWIAEVYGANIKRKRNCAEMSLTVSHKRPDLLWLVGGTLLFKGEDKTNDADMDVALGELTAKMKNWSSNYHGQASEVAGQPVVRSLMFAVGTSHSEIALLVMH